MVFWKHFKAEEITLKRYTHFLWNLLIPFFVCLSWFLLSWKWVITRMTVLKVSSLFFLCKYPVWCHCTLGAILHSQERLNILHSEGETRRGAVARKDFLHLSFWSLRGSWTFWSQLQTYYIECHYMGTKQKWEIIFPSRISRRVDIL